MAHADHATSGLKQCKRCGQYRPVALYYRNRHTKDGKSSYCKSCSNEYVSRWREELKKNPREYAAHLNGELKAHRERGRVYTPADHDD